MLYKYRTQEDISPKTNHLSPTHTNTTHCNGNRIFNRMDTTRQASVAPQAGTSITRGSRSTSYDSSTDLFNRSTRRELYRTRHRHTAATTRPTVRHTGHGAFVSRRKKPVARRSYLLSTLLGSNQPSSPCTTTPRTGSPLRMPKSTPARPHILVIVPRVARMQTVRGVGPSSDRIVERILRHFRWLLTELRIRISGRAQDARPRQTRSEC
jgi:hypothetical protein